MSRLCFLPSFIACLTLAAVVSAADEPTLEQRLEKLAESLESAREDANVPGMSIAIVKDDEVVWARGFGLADLAAERPADEGTIYAIGSTTKAFTAALVGMLVDEGKATWDDPVTRYLPYFDLQVRTYWIDAEHGDVLRAKHTALEGSIRIPVTTDYSSFEETDGIRRAMVVEIRNPESGKTVLTFDKVESGLELEDEVFTIEDPDEE